MFFSGTTQNLAASNREISIQATAMESTIISGTASTTMHDISWVEFAKHSPYIYDSVCKHPAYTK